MTEGKPVITDLYNYGSADILALAAAAEKNSEHPLAQAVLKAAEGRELPEVSSFKAWPGLGIEAQIQGQEIWVGSSRFLQQQQIELDQELIPKWEAEGKTLILVAADGQLAGILAAADQPRPTAAKAVNQLQQMGIKVKMLTGDNWRTAQAVGQQVGISDIAAEVLPGDKARLVQEEKAQGHLTAMVGDGINDAPALSSADVGIALNSGTDIALESADLVLMDNDPEQIVRAIRLSRAALRNIRQNLGWALFYNCLALPLAAAGCLNPIIAGTAMAFSSVSVVANALRLKKFQ
ncbi:MAG: HAD-IC family P-type ATPase [Clostridia bacterium]|nr:HAD-IC family P-type ATPase [Clostridia bacterium]